MVSSPFVHTVSAASVFTWQAPSFRPALSCHLFCLYDWFTMSYEASSPPSSVVRDQVSSYYKRLMVTQTALGVTGGNTHVRLSSLLWVQISLFSKIAWGCIYLYRCTSEAWTRELADNCISVRNGLRQRYEVIVRACTWWWCSVSSPLHAGDSFLESDFKWFKADRWCVHTLSVPISTVSFNTIKLNLSKLPLFTAKYGK